MCPDAYREALMREIRRRANPEPGDLDRRGVAAVGTAAKNSPATALAEDAPVVNDGAPDLVIAVPGRRPVR